MSENRTLEIPLSPSPSETLAAEASANAFSTVTPEPSKRETPPDSEIPLIEPGLEPLVEQARTDLARLLEIDADLIEAQHAESVTWPDASLGCPQPGMQYKQVPEDGARIVLRAMEMIYEYHAGGSRGLFLCETLVKDPDQSPKIDINIFVPPTKEIYLPPAPDK